MVTAEPSSRDTVTTTLDMPVEEKYSVAIPGLRPKGTKMVGNVNVPLWRYIGMSGELTVMAKGSPSWIPFNVSEMGPALFDTVDSWLLMTVYEAETAGIIANMKTAAKIVNIPAYFILFVLFTPRL
jgi:DNA-binding transcriptional MocR family regulator